MTYEQTKVLKTMSTLKVSLMDHTESCFLSVVFSWFWTSINSADPASQSFTISVLGTSVPSVAHIKNLATVFFFMSKIQFNSRLHKSWALHFHCPELTVQLVYWAKTHTDVLSLPTTIALTLTGWPLEKGIRSHQCSQPTIPRFYIPFQTRIRSSSCLFTMPQPHLRARSMTRLLSPIAVVPLLPSARPLWLLFTWVSTVLFLRGDLLILSSETSSLSIALCSPYSVYRISC